MDHPGTSRPLQKIALVGNHLPRRCGIATFTTDLTAAIAGAAPNVECLVVAMNDPGSVHAYPGRVRFEISEGEIASYRRAAQFLNVNRVDAVSLQHEYGIFGGKSGSHVLALLRELRMPVVTTLHTVLRMPSVDQRAVLDEVIALSERMVTMSTDAAETLTEVHGVSPEFVDVIPHGIPVAEPGSRGKAALGFEDQALILTFGLLSPDKGIEYVLDALPAILGQNPNAVFVVLGATHPHVKQASGESYRLSLVSEARRLGVEASVLFHDRFVGDRELADFLAAADVYVTPYLNPEQSTSGTLARAVAAGRAAISTPYRYARELLADGRGVLVPFRNSVAIAQAVNELLANDAERMAVGVRAAEHGRNMAWPIVAESYLEAIRRAVDGKRVRRTSAPLRPLAPADLPELNLDHLETLTDRTGMLQHAASDVPQYEHGYRLDDNARALLLTTLMEDTGALAPDAARELGARYLAFLMYAYNPQAGRFRSLLSYSRRWVEEIGSEDSHGRAIWALGTLVGRSNDSARRQLASELFQKALVALGEFSSPRAWAYGLLGIHEYLRAFRGDSMVQASRKLLVSRLVELHEQNHDSAWDWFETSVTYANARMSQALIVSGAAMESENITSIGLRSLAWLVGAQVSDNGCFAPVGTNGFYSRGAAKASFDQQPLEAAGMVSACLDALRVTRNARWSAEARRAFDWFLGQNHLQQPLYDATTGGCRDGLHADRANQNQGAESTLSFLIALVEMRSVDPLAASGAKSR